MSEYSRREFVGAAAAGVVGAASGLVVPALAALGRGGSGMIRVGLVGCGGRGTGAAMNALRAGPDVRLVAMGDLFPERIDSCLARLSKAREDEAGSGRIGEIDVPADRRFVGFDACDRLLACGVDVVMLVGYPHFRPAQLEAAVRADKHVFLEKPVAVDSSGVRRVRDAAMEARRRGLSVVSGFCWRYALPERATFGVLHGGLIGRVVSAHSTYHSTTLSKHPRRAEWSDMEFQLRNWWHFCWLSGDHVVEQAVHSVDRLAWAFGDEDPIACTCLGGRQARTGEESGDVYDHFAAAYEYPGGRRGVLTCRQIDGCPSDNSDYIMTEGGSCEVNGWKPVHELRDRAGNVAWSYAPVREARAARPGLGVGDMYQHEVDHLMESVRNARAVNDGELMCRSTLMAIMARMSAYSGKRVEWTQAWDSPERLGPAEGSYSFSSLAAPVVPVPGRGR